MHSSVSKDDLGYKVLSVMLLKYIQIESVHGQGLGYQQMKMFYFEARIYFFTQQTY